MINAYLVVRLGTVEGADDQIDNAQMEHLLVRVIVAQYFLLFLKFAHDLFSL